MSALEELGREITLSAKQGFVLKSLKEGHACRWQYSPAEGIKG